MYNIYNIESSFSVKNIITGEVRFIGDELDLIDFLADGYKEIRLEWEDFKYKWEDFKYKYKVDDVEYVACLNNSYFTSFVCNETDIKPRSKWIFYQASRIFNPKGLEKQAQDRYIKKHGRKPPHIVYDRARYIKEKIYKGEFRKDPVPYTGKKKGGPCKRNRRTHQKKLIASIPEYSMFNRQGDLRNVEDYYGDRINERNWKSQSKRRHQWKEKQNK